VKRELRPCRGQLLGSAERQYGMNEAKRADGSSARRGAVAVGLVLLMLSTSCGRFPEPPPPEMACDDARLDPLPVLTCEDAVIAAMERLPFMLGPVERVEFIRGFYCPDTGQHCPAADGSHGYAIFTFEAGSVAYVEVAVGERSAITTSPAQMIPDGSQNP
jgi:hypothetical protein